MWDVGIGVFGIYYNFVAEDLLFKTVKLKKIRT